DMGCSARASSVLRAVLLDIVLLHAGGSKGFQLRLIVGALCFRFRVLDRLVFTMHPWTMHSRPSFVPIQTMQPRPSFVPIQREGCVIQVALGIRKAVCSTMSIAAFHATQNLRVDPKASGMLIQLPALLSYLPSSFLASSFLGIAVFSGHVRPSGGYSGHSNVNVKSGNKFLPRSQRRLAPYLASLRSAFFACYSPQSSLKFCTGALVLRPSGKRRNQLTTDNWQLVFVCFS